MDAAGFCHFMIGPLSFFYYPIFASIWQLLWSCLNFDLPVRVSKSLPQMREMAGIMQAASKTALFSCENRISV